ncbi:glycosyltransferase family 2 protein [Synechococcus sp. RedBA-s]|nr:glycosyltransferase family 2 protein [Synechococcus sp. RedBA-s]
MYVACDGPRSTVDGDLEKIVATRRVIDAGIDWPCQLEQLYFETNQGCRMGVIQAINWLFSHESEGIILEDDCLPHKDFFLYCTDLLERYRDDTRIWSICGSNFQQGHQRGAASYFFSIHGDSWGWATWKRAWKHFDQAKDDWPMFKESAQFDQVFQIIDEREYWSDILDELFIHGRPDTWDYQWWLAGWMNHALHAWPNTCLVSNLGFDGDGTHTFGDSPFAAIPLEPLGSLQHPQFVAPDGEADRYAFLHRRGGLQRIKHHRHRHWHVWSARWLNFKQQGPLRYISGKLTDKLNGRLQF